jgi:glycosyltransferase involved in cell wall biosynthesis
MARILVVQNMYPPHHYGGYELSCRDVVDRWRRRGHTVEVLTGDLRRSGVDDPAGERAAGVRRDLPIAFRDGELLSPPLWRRPGLERRAQRRLREALESTRPDVVSMWHMAALPTGLITTLVRSGLPLVYVVCDDWLSYTARIDPWMRLFVDRPALGRVVETLTHLPATVPDLGASGTFCFVSRLTEERSLAHTAWTFPMSTVTYSGIDLDDFPLAHAEAGASRAWEWRLLHVGRLDARKGIDVAIRALAHLPAEATLELLGSGDPSYGDELRRVAAEAGVTDRVRFGSVPRDELAARYAAADAFVFPTDWEEPFGLVPLEAMACATPVVATGRGGSAEFLVDGENCLLFPAGDPEALAGAVRRLAESAELRHTLVVGGLRTAAELTVDRLAEVLEAWHLAAAARFADGTPAHRAPVRPQDA